MTLKKACGKTSADDAERCRSMTIDVSTRLHPTDALPAKHHVRTLAAALDAAIG